MRLFLRVLSICLLLLTLSLNLWATPPHHILYINSYHPTFPTFFQQLEGIQSVFSRQPLHLDIEFMDTKRFPGPETVRKFHAALSEKLAKLPSYDAIIVADDNALSFAIDYQSQLFPNLPIVFLGVNNIDLALQQNANPYITGVVEAISMQETIALIKSLSPQTRRIVALVDNLPSGQADLKSFYSCQKEFPDLEFSELSLAQQTFASFAKQLRTLGPEDTALLLSAYQDSSGQNLQFEDSLALISKNLSRPLYHLWEHGMGEGVLGGKIISHRQQGASAAQIVLKILTGTPVESIPVTNISPNRYEFDYREMQKFGISPSMLPDHSSILNRPHSYYQQHKPIILTSAVIFLGYSLLLFAMFRTIRTRRKAQIKLKESEGHLKDLIDQSPVGLALCRMDGSFLTVNAAYANIIGYSVEETLKLTYWDVTPKEYVASEEQQLKLLEQTGNYGPYEKEYYHRDGHLVPVRLKGMVYYHDNQKLIWSSVEDITTLRENRRLEEQLRQSQKMEAIGTLAGGIAHDFNNILAAILGYTELVLRNQETLPLNRKKLEHVYTAAKRAKDLVKQILTFSRKEKENREPLSLNAIINEAALLLHNTIPKSVMLKVDMGNKDCQVLADATQMHQVIMNLCTNAFHALPKESGEIHISLTQTNMNDVLARQYPELTQKQYAVISISDNGSGIPPEVLPRIFDPFFTTKKSGAGTGMGLAVVLGIIQSHDGAIGVESTLGEGTTFTVFLPITNSMSATPPPEAEATDLHGTERILFVDDEIMLTSLGKEMLESLGYRVTVATSGDQALALFRANPDFFDAIVTDQTMLGITGDVLAQETLQLRPALPVIICTGHTTLIDAGKAQQLGIAALLTKPISRDSLAAEIRKALDTKGTGS